MPRDSKRPLTQEQMHIENERRLTRLEVGMLVLIVSEGVRWAGPIISPALGHAIP